MSSSIQPPNRHIPENAIFERSANFSEEETSLPLSPVSINLSLLPILIWSKESKSPRLTYTTSLDTEPERPSKKPRRPDADEDNNLDAQIEGVKNELRIVGEKFDALLNKKAVILEPFDAANFSQGETSLPLSPVSINLLLFPKLIWSKDSENPRLKFTTSLVTEAEEPSKKPRRTDADNKAEMEGLKIEIGLLFKKLHALQNKKTIFLRSSETAAATECGRKLAETSKSCWYSCGCGHQGIIYAEPKRRMKRPIEGQKPPNIKGQKSSIAKIPDGMKGTAAVCTKKSEKREDATIGNLKPRTLLHEQQNPATSKRPANSDIMEVVASPCKQPGLELKRKRCKWSPDN